MVEEIPGVERAISQEFVDIAGELVCPRASHDVDLGSGTLAVLRAVSILNN